VHYLIVKVLAYFDIYNIKEYEKGYQKEYECNDSISQPESFVMVAVHFIFAMSAVRHVLFISMPAFLTYGYI